MSIIAFSRSLRDFLNGESLVVSGKSQFQYLEPELELIREALSLGTAVSIEHVVGAKVEDSGEYLAHAHDPLSAKFMRYMERELAHEDEATMGDISRLGVEPVVRSKMLSALNAGFVVFLVPLLGQTYRLVHCLHDNS